jgi:hypothetical protein
MRPIEKENVCRFEIGRDKKSTIVSVSHAKIGDRQRERERKKEKK